MNYCPIKKKSPKQLLASKNTQNIVLSNKIVQLFPDDIFSHTNDDDHTGSTREIFHIKNHVDNFTTIGICIRTYRTYHSKTMSEREA